MAQQVLMKRPLVDEESIDEITVSSSLPLAYEHEQTSQPHAANCDKIHGEHPQKSRPATENLRRQGYIIYLVLFYAAMLCRSTYGCFNEYNSCSESSEDLASQNLQTTRYINNAQTLLSAVSLLTIPLTSAICAAAVVPWLQQSGQGMSLRQIMALSDKGWTSPYIYYRLLLPAGWRRYGSSFIALALLVQVPKASLAPRVRIIDLHRLLGDRQSDGLIILTLRDVPKSVNPVKILPQMWVPVIIDCATEDKGGYDGSYLPNSTQCPNGGMAYLSLTTEPEAWISQLGSGFSTGVKTAQYIPHVNSSVEVELLDELPAECDSVNASLLIYYAGASYQGGRLNCDWSVKVCIPEYDTPTFEDTDNAQTLVETAFLDLDTFNIMDQNSPYHNITKITMSTTIRYFELPNYNNRNRPGPLLQNYTSPIRLNKRRQSDLDYTLSLGKNTSQKYPYLQIMPNAGPLANIINALFGNGSWPSIYLTENATYNPGGPLSTEWNEPCVDVILLSKPVRTFAPYAGANTEGPFECLNYADVEQGVQMHWFLSSFFVLTQALERIFRAAAYINHEIWLTGYLPSLAVEYDAGQDLQVPSLTECSIIALTIAIAIYLLSLLMLAFYASFSKTWTYSLDAHALLRIGAGLGKGSLPFLVIQDAHHVGELDELPDFVGDVTEHEDSKERQLGMSWNGTVTRQVKPVQKDRHYMSYPKMPHWDALQVFCSWCNTIFGLGGLRRTRADLKIQKANAWLQHTREKFVESMRRSRIRLKNRKANSWWGRTTQKCRTWVRQAKLGRWWNGDHLGCPKSKGERPGCESVGQDSVA